MEGQVVGESRSDLLPLAFVVAMRSAGNAETRARARARGSDGPE